MAGVILMLRWRVCMDSSSCVFYVATARDGHDPFHDVELFFRGLVEQKPCTKRTRSHSAEEVALGRKNGGLLL